MALPTTPVFRGYAVVEGCAGVFNAVINTGVTQINQSATLTQNWEDEILKDVHGGDVSWLMRNENATLDIELYLVADTAAHAAAPIQANGTAATVSSLGLPIFAPGSVLTLSGFTYTGLNGVFRVMSGVSVALTNTNAAKYSMKLLKYANADQETQMAVIPG